MGLPNSVTGGCVCQRSTYRLDLTSTPENEVEVSSLIYVSRALVYEVLTCPSSFLQIHTCQCDSSPAEIAKVR